MIYIHWIYLLLYMAIMIPAIITVLMDNRQPAKTMAWILVLAFMPFVGIIFYIFFGQNTRKERQTPASIAWSTGPYFYR
jgi:cardiolipin synthase